MRDKPARDGSGWPHDESLADGHRWDTERVGASEFPDDWTDQKIVDAIRDTVEHPDFGEQRGHSLRRLLKEIDGVTIEVKYTVLPDGTAKSLQAYPIEES